MRGPGVAGAALLGAWLSACAPAAPAARPAPEAPPAAAAAEAVADPAVTADGAEWYRPPLAIGASGQPPRVPIASRLANGVRTTLLQRRDSLLVAARFVVRRQEREPSPGAATLLAQMLLRAAPAKGGRALLEELESLGVQSSAYASEDALHIELVAAAPAFEEALGKVLSTIAEPALTEAGLEERRAALKRSLRDEASPRATDRLLDEIEVRLYPARHRYAEPRASAADVDAVRLADLSRYHAREVTPAGLAVCVVGDVTSALLNGVVDRTVGAWKQPAGRPARAASPLTLAERRAARAAKPLPLARGVVLVEEPADRKAALAVVLPWPAPGSTADLAGERFLVGQVDAAAMSSLRREIKGSWRDGRTRFLSRAEASLMVVSVEVQAEDLAPAARAIVDAIAALGRDGASSIERSRIQELRWQEGLFASNLEAARRLSYLDALGLAPDYWSRIYQTTLSTSQAEVDRIAAAQLVKGEARVVALGDVASARPELEKLGLGPVTLVRAGGPAAAPPAGKAPPRRKGP